VSALPLPPAVLAASGRELCTVLDLSKCIGCEACVDACRDNWQAGLADPAGPIPRPFPPRVPVEDWSGRKGVQNRLTPYNFLYVEHLEVEQGGQKRQLHVPRRCMHCNTAPCANLCPFGACKTEANGVTHIDQDICFGGAKCKNVCPWSIPQRQSGVGLYLSVMPQYAGNGVMRKCHRCLPLLAQGQEPACIEVCPERVQSIGPRPQQIAKAQELARAMAAADGQPAEKWADYVYGLNENGGTGTIYVSPVPVNRLSSALDQAHQGRMATERQADEQAGRPPQKGNLGRPHLRPVANSMESARNLSLALAVAPVAGLAAGLGRLWSGVRKAGQVLAQAGVIKGGRS
jgi:Fe-S-cluster-containing dehydrogenase component